MEKYGIMDLVSKLQSLATNQKQENTQKESDVTPPNKQKTSDDKSFLHTYNPFNQLNAERPQVISPKAKRPTKTTIDLSTSKNLASEKNVDKTNNMVELINRHNYLSSTINGKNKKR